MKFLTLTIAALLGMTDATRLSGKYTSDGKFTSKLLKHAQPYDRQSKTITAGRKLDGQNNGITGAHSIIFKSCESLTVQANFDNNDNNGNNGGNNGGEENGNNGDNSYSMQTLYSQGAIKAQYSYILFDVCLSQNCFSGYQSDRSTYVVDMATFINAFADYIPTKQADYCQACYENRDFCFYNDESNLYGGDDNRAGSRKIENGEVTEVINCRRCRSYGCFSNNYNYEEEENGEEEEEDPTTEWIQTMSYCKQSDDPFYYNGMEVSMGFMCNQDGTGVEVAAFLDEDCVMYTNQVAFGNVVSQEEYQYWIESRQTIQYMFNSGFSCYEPDVTYVDPTEADDNFSYNTVVVADDDAEVSEWCQMVFQGDMEPTSMANCGGDNNNNNNNQNNNQNNNGARKLEQYNNGGGGGGQSYALSQDYIEDGYSVCQALNGLGGQGEHLYDKSGSGAMYKYTGAGSSSSNQQQQSSYGNWEEGLDEETNQAVSQKNATNQMGSAVGLFFVGVAGAAMVVGAILLIKRRNSDDKRVPMLQMDDDKQGAMA